MKFVPSKFWILERSPVASLIFTVSNALKQFRITWSAKEFEQRIKERPGMYMGKPSITRLSMLLTGYAMARAELGLPVTEQEKECGGFQDWIQERYKITSIHGWDSIILFNSADERDAVDNFFKLFEQFQNGEKVSMG